MVPYYSVVWSWCVPASSRWRWRRTRRYFTAWPSGLRGEKSGTWWRSRSPPSLPSWWGSPPPSSCWSRWWPWRSTQWRRCSTRCVLHTVKRVGSQKVVFWISFYNNEILIIPMTKLLSEDHIVIILFFCEVKSQKNCCIKKKSSAPNEPVTENIENWEYFKNISWKKQHMQHFKWCKRGMRATLWCHTAKFTVLAEAPKYSIKAGSRKWKSMKKKTSKCGLLMALLHLRTVMPFNAKLRKLHNIFPQMRI